MAVVLDASALLAFWLGEEGGTIVRDAIEAEGAIVASVNLAEVVAKMDDLHPGFAERLPAVPTRVASEATITPADATMRAGVLVVEPFTLGDAVVSGQLRVATKQRGLSLGDRACLGLGKRLGLVVLTADRAWASIADAAGVVVRVIR